MNNNKNKILSNTKHHAVTQNKAITWFRSKSSEECRSNSTSKICLGRMKTFKLKHKRRPNWFIKPKEPQASFTLVELLVVLALIAILATVLIVVIKPTDIFKKGRDTKRVSDLSNIEKLLDSIYATDYTFSELQYASSNVVYISLPDSNPNCSSWLSQLPSLPSGFSYRCSATPENTDGTGWIPIPFANFPILNIPQLPIDPINKPPYYYSFVAGGSYALYAQLENPQSQASKNDNDNYPHLFSAGTNKRLIDQAQGLVGYWSFDDLDPSTGKALDLSGFNNHGTIYSSTTICTNYPNPPSGCPQWVTGKVGKALSFDGVDDYVNLSSLGLNNPSLYGGPSGSMTFMALIKPIRTTGIDYDTIARRIGGFHYLAIISSSDRRLRNMVRDCVNNVNYWPISNVVADINNWSQIVFIFNGYNGYKYYINGNLDIEYFNSNICISNYGTDSAIGAQLNSDSNYFQGLIDEVRIYNRALSDQEIKALYEATK